MLIVACLECFTAVRVMGPAERVDPLVGRTSEFWPKGYVCVSCGRKGLEGIEEIEAEAGALARLKLRELTAEEMYAAQLGLGTPDEMVCDSATVTELLSQPIKKVVGYDVPCTQRFCLTELELESGVKLHFGSSAHGAIVYRITRRVSYTNKALERSP